MIRANRRRRVCCRFEGRTTVGIPFAHKRQRQDAKLGRQALIAQSAVTPGNPARRTVVHQAA